MANKKAFTKADNAIERLFTAANPDNDTHVTNVTIASNVTKHTHDINDTNVTNVLNQSYDTNVLNDTYDTNIANVYKHTHVTNVSKHYNKRGKRGERLGLLLDERLKEDLTQLSKAVGSKSVNDLLVTILLEYVEREDNRLILEQYRKLFH